MQDANLKGRLFFSLRWKVLINLMSVLAIVHLAYGYYSYKQQTTSAVEQRVLKSERDLSHLEGLVTSSYNRLLELGELIAYMSGNAVAETHQSDYRAHIEKMFPDLHSRGALDAAYLYDSHGKSLVSLGDKLNLPQSIIDEVLETESPYKYFDCQSDCLRFVALPVQLDRVRTGVLVVGKKMGDVVLDFNSQSGRDIGLALQPKGQARMARLWQLDLKYLTQRADNAVLLNRLVKQQNIPSGGGFFEIERDDRRFMILLHPLLGAKKGKAYWILIDDHTESYHLARNELFEELAVSGIGLFLAALFQLVVLRSPLRTLSEIVELLPLLALSGFEQVRQRFKEIEPHHHRKDELDLLLESTFDLSNKLEHLESSLKERAKHLMHRTQELESERDFVTSLLDTTDAIILTLDRKGHIVTLNRSGQKLLGLNVAEAKLLHFLELNHEQKNQAVHRESLNRLYSNEQERVQLESVLRSAGGQMLHISWVHTVLHQPGYGAYVLSIGMDVTEQKKAERRLVWMANHDSLTALPNRLQFTDRVNQAIKQCQGENEIVALLFCDLDCFKDVNDSLGHPVGDDLLQQAAERIQVALNGAGLLARLGGDEFTVLMEGKRSITEVEKVAQCILDAFRRSFYIDGYEIYSTISIGISYYPEHGAEVNALIQHADVAMFEAKEHGKNQHRFYHDEQGSQRYERFSLINDLRRAIEKKELRVFYQPQINTQHGEVIGVEALLRWEHEELGMISPAKFIPLAEEQGLIIPIGEWVLQQACEFGKSLHDQGVEIRIGVNLAGQQILHESLIPTVERVLSTTKMQAKYLDLEVTESFLVRQPEITIPKLHRLREIGVSLSMDDFGTGFSSLSYLKKLPLNTLKIDQSFIRDIGVNPEGEAIVKAIIALSRSLGLSVLAEGVETREQLSYLRTHRCELIQGFYFSKPLPVDELPDFIAQQAVEISFE
ncbi:EAL domain-containing protein [uncultured Neptuniibacter sp.]|uniref:bifunctional diguanylate cyclase/phosphodiesterase n=1 Tax=uncultured Neptuniibacter sp. TaxID=502143 RepID=UPI0026216696|nr:EAL domain-containing protein [uncultured Neptuniibacter sp.]